MMQTDQDAAARGAFEELALENARLLRLVGELLLKNQWLREAISNERIAAEEQQGSA